MVRHCVVYVLWLVTYTAVIYNVCASNLLAENLERESDGGHKWREHDHYSDSGHNADFDLEILLGSVQLAEEFQNLSAEEATEKITEILKQKDLNGDQFIDRDELISWILSSYKSLSHEDAVRRLLELDADGDGLVSWSEHLQDTFGVATEAEVADDVGESGAMLQDEKEMFEAADRDGNGVLDMVEYEVFTNPEAHDEMHSLVLKQALRDKDRDGDNQIDYAEFLGDREDNPEYRLSEKVRFDEEDLDKDGVLSGKEIQHWLMPGNDELAEEEADHVLELADADGDGRISYSELLAARHGLFPDGEGEGEGEDGDEDVFRHFDDEL